ncbi:MAG: TonB-dependent receptor [Candidatus Kapaibacterium sp.]
MRWFYVIVCLMVTVVAAEAQTGTINGKVKTKDGSPANGVVIKIASLRTGTLSNSLGIFVMTKIPVGTYTMEFGGVGYKKSSRQVVVKANEITLVEDAVETDVKSMNEVTVYGASRREQKITEAPSAISVVLPEELTRATSHGQAAKTMANLQGVDVVQSGMNDFNVNTRGFNNSINRRTLVLIDGRDPSTPLLNLVEWNSFAVNVADIKSIEVVRGPGSALFGQNAYNGVVSITSYSPKEVLGTRVSVTGGMAYSPLDTSNFGNPASNTRLRTNDGEVFNTFRADIRHAQEFGDLSIKINAGYSQQEQTWIFSRDTTGGRNSGDQWYAGLARDVAGKTFANGAQQFAVDSLLDEHKVAFNYFGTLRADYELNHTSKIIGEIGFSKYGNEYFVNQTGRILIPNVEKPFARLAYYSPRFTAQAQYYNRNTPEAQLVLNASASSAERSNVGSVEAQWNDSFIDDKLKVIVGASHEIQNVNTSVVNALPLLKPDTANHNFTGVYGQVDYAVLDELHIVGAARVDRSTLFKTQFSPKVGITYSLMHNHNFRVTLNRSFMRPSYGDFWRRSPGGAPVAMGAKDTAIANKWGVTPLGLNTLSVWNLGNPNLDVETAMSYEFGYKGIISNQLYVTVDIYSNRRTNFVSVPLGGLAPDIYKQIGYTGANADSANAELKATLGATNFSRLAIDPITGKPALIITPTNIGTVDEQGAEIGINYYATDNLLITANATWLSTKVQDNKVPAQNIVPNTSPRRYNIGAQYTENGFWDAGFNLRYVDQFKWIAGLFEGTVPSYAVLDINASLDMSRWVKGARLGVNVFNALNRKHYEIFGGTYLYRYATATLSYQF